MKLKIFNKKYKHIQTVISEPKDFNDAMKDLDEYMCVYNIKDCCFILEGDVSKNNESKEIKKSWWRKAPKEKEKRFDLYG